MDNDRRRRRRGDGLRQRSEAAIRNTLEMIESRVRELEAEARHLGDLRCVLAAISRYYEEGEPGSRTHEFLDLNLTIRRECLRILKHLAAEGQPPVVPRVVVVKIPVFIQPKPSAN
jgi:hypothetical protein